MNVVGVGEGEKTSGRAVSYSGIASSFGLTLLIWAVLSGPVKFWDLDGAFVFGSSRPLTILSLSIIAISFLANKRQVKGLFVDPLGAALVLPVIFLSDWLARPYGLFPFPAFRGEVLFFGAAFYFLFPRYRNLLPWVLFLSVALLVWCFFDAASGHLIFSDDHPSGLYRLQALKELFPRIPAYNTWWNAGTDARDFFATGIINVFLIFYPLIKFFELFDIYNLLVALLFFVLVPGISASVGYLSASRFEPNKRRALAAASGLLSLATSLLWYRWCLKYGTLGFVTSSALIPLNLWFVGKIISPDEKLSRLEAVIFSLSFTLMLLWSLTGLVFLPVVVAALWLFPRVISKPYIKQIAVALLVLNLPWMVVFTSVSQVGKFLSFGKPSFVGAQESAKEVSVAQTENSAGSAVTGQVTERGVKAGGGSLSFKSCLKGIRNFCVTLNPLLLVFALPGIALLRPGVRFSYSLTLLWAIFLGTVISPVKSQLELERMLVIGGLICCVPAAHALLALSESVPTRLKRTAQMVFALAGGFLLSGVFAVCAIVYNRSMDHYAFADDVVTEMVEAIKQYGGDGRTLFSSFILHELSGGHIAPLVYLAGHPLIASSPVHNVWWYTDIIPEDFRRLGGLGIEQYMDLMNVTSVFAHDKNWRHYFESATQYYTPVWRGGKFKLYQRHAGVSSYFQEGSGKILTQGSSGVVLRVDTEQVILRFAYYPFLEASGCEISPAQFGETTKLIKLSKCVPGTEISIRSKGPVKRLWQSLRGARGE